METEEFLLAINHTQPLGIDDTEKWRVKMPRALSAHNFLWNCQNWSYGSSIPVCFLHKRGQFLPELREMSLQHG